MNKRNGLILTLCACLLSVCLAACGAGAERKAPDLIELSYWYFTSGMPNNVIEVHAEKDCTVEIETETGFLWTGKEYCKELTQSGAEPVRTRWSFFTDRGEEFTENYIDVILLDEGGVCGYAVIEVSEGESGYQASVLKAVTLRESVDRAEADARIAKAKADAA